MVGSQLSVMREEAITFGRYLLGGENPDGKSVELYIEAHQHRNLAVTDSEKKLFEFVLRNSWALGAVDGALAFKNPKHVIRKKLVVMSAVLECRPAYAELFLPQKRSAFYFVVFCWVGFRALCKALFGRILLAIAG